MFDSFDIQSEVEISPVCLPVLNSRTPSINIKLDMYQLRIPPNEPGLRLKKEKQATIQIGERYYFAA